GRTATSVGRNGDALDHGRANGPSRRVEAPAELFARATVGVAPAARTRTAPSRSAPLALMLRRDAGWLRASAAVGQAEPPALSPLAERVRDELIGGGAQFLGDLVARLAGPTQSARGPAHAAGSTNDAASSTNGAASSTLSATTRAHIAASSTNGAASST